jgi:alpha-L-fucosidase
VTLVPRVKALLPVVVTAAAAAVLPLAAQPAYVPTPENVAARARFREMRFGMFIHWGIYSLLQDGEWVMNNRASRCPSTRRWRRSSVP